MAINRVEKRVASGGHNIPEETIRRRYASGIKNFKGLFMPVCDYWMLFDNSESPSVLIAEHLKKTKIKIHQQSLFNKIAK